MKTKPTPTKLIIKPPRPALLAQRAADLVNQLDDRDSVRTFWDALDEPTREHLLTWFAEWDKDFCEALNPAIA